MPLTRSVCERLDHGHDPLVVAMLQLSDEYHKGCIFKHCNGHWDYCIALVDGQLYFVDDAGEARRCGNLCLVEADQFTNEGHWRRTQLTKHVRQAVSTLEGSYR